MILIPALVRQNGKLSCLRLSRDAHIPIARRTSKTGLESLLASRFRTPIAARAEHPAVSSYVIQMNMQRNPQNTTNRFLLVFLVICSVICTKPCLLALLA